MYTCVCVCGGGTFCFREESGCCGSRQTLTYFTAVDLEDNFFSSGAHQLFCTDTDFWVKLSAEMPRLAEGSIDKQSERQAREG